MDSALLAVAATEALGPGRFLAVIGKSASYPDAQYRAALEVAHRFGVPLREVETRELEDPRYLANPIDRCYFCKAELWTRLTALARSEGSDSLIDGTNADDLGEHRPGSPPASNFASDLRSRSWASRRRGSASRPARWESRSGTRRRRPASRAGFAMGFRSPETACARSRRREALLRSLGLSGDLRVRHLGDRASIEVRPDQFPRLEERWSEVVEGFTELGFGSVERDPRGYRRGNLLVLESTSA